VSDEFVLPKDKSPIICPRTEDMERPAAAARSMIGDCGHEVWVAQSSLNMIESDIPTVVTCMQCVIPALTQYKENNPDDKIELRMAPGAKEEIRAEFEEAMQIPIPVVSEEEYDEAVGVDK
jgi:hypothetical protein